MKTLFSADSKSLFLVKRHRDVDVFTIPPLDSSESIEFCETIQTSAIIEDTISQIEISQCGKYLVCAGLCGNIGVWKLHTQRKKAHWKHLLNLPKYKLPPTALAIHRNSPKLVATFADSKVHLLHFFWLYF